MAKYFLQQNRIPPGFYIPGVAPKKVPKPLATPGILLVDMLDAPDVVGGFNQLIGFSLTLNNDQPFKGVVPVELLVSDSIDLTVPSDFATLSEAVTGRIAYPESAAAIKVFTDGNGEFACKLSVTKMGTFYIGAKQTYGGPLLNCSEWDAVTFS